MDCPYKSFWIEEYNTRPSYSKNEWCKILGIESTMSTAYHPQTDGQMEHVNQTLEQYLRCYVNYNLSNWSDLLPSAEFTYNNQAHKGIKESPFYLEYGRHLRAGPILVKESLQRDLNDLTYKRQDALEQAKAALTLAAERMKWYYNTYRSRQQEFRIEKLVII